MEYMDQQWEMGDLTLEFQLLGRDLLAVAGVAGAVAAEVICQDVALGANWRRRGRGLVGIYLLLNL